MKKVSIALIALLGAVVLIAAWLTLGRHGDTPSVLARGGGVDGVPLKDPALIERGEYLARVGDCAACHTARGGAAFAGGRSLATPFGEVPAPNLTPDGATGIGGWTFDQFWQAMHLGKGPDGRLLYPAFPYTSYTRVKRQDAMAIFAYLQSLPPVHREDQPATIRFPYNLHASLVAWRQLYFKEGTFIPDPDRSAQWNRGAYLVQGLGHCNECHVARDSLGGAAGGLPLSGGRIPVQDWYAPDLSTGDNGGLQGWRERDIVDLLRTGMSSRGAAFGPMAEVVSQSTQYLQDEDLQAIASYLGSLPPRPAPAPADNAPSASTSASVDRGSQLYAKRCADCHGLGGKGVAAVYPPLDGNSSLTEPTGINAIRMVLLGGFAPTTEANPRPYSMPPYAQQLDDQQVADVVSYIRQAWSNHAPPVQQRDVAAYRHTPSQ